MAFDSDVPIQLGDFKITVCFLICVCVCEEGYTIILLTEGVKGFQSDKQYLKLTIKILELYKEVSHVVKFCLLYKQGHCVPSETDAGQRWENSIAVDPKENEQHFTVGISRYTCREVLLFSLKSVWLLDFFV